jgi:hypothetical protein
MPLLLHTSGARTVGQTSSDQMTKWKIACPWMRLGFNYVSDVLTPLSMHNILSTCGIGACTINHMLLLIYFYASRVVIYLVCTFYNCK